APKLPWTNVKVRQAMNKAINRKELLRALYKNRASPMYVHGFYPGLEGWDPSWEKRFPEMYGYDPAAAKRLLAEAGYPNGFKAKAWLYPFAGGPELIALMEAVAAQLRKIGNYKFENFETIPRFDVYIEVVVDPKIVADWPFSGWDGGDIGHTWLIKACRDQKPCK